jgi:hypothetical protein
MDETLLSAVQRLSASALSRGLVPQAVHQYKDTAGRMLHAVIRLKHPDTGEKWVRPVHLTEHGYEFGMPPYAGGKPIYRLDIVAAKPDEEVHVCEGELCVDNLIKLRVLATTSGGAQSAPNADWTPLRRRRVTIWPDNDEAGRHYAEDVAKALLALDCEVRVVDVGALALPRGGDVVDWLAAHPDATCADVRSLPAIDAAAYLRSADLAFSNRPNAVPAWSAPKAIEAPLRPVAPFDANLLPEALRTWVMDEADRMPCPPEFIAVAAIVALGAVIGARCAIKPKSNDTWLVVPNLWGCIVASPSAKKSPAIAAALKPLDRLIAAARAAHESEQADFEAAHTVFEAKRDAIKKRVSDAAKDATKGDVDSIAHELQRHRHETPQAPVLRRYKSNDSTVEKLGELLRENPAGLLVLRDELPGLLASWEREGREGDRTFFLEAWNGTGSFDTDRIGRGSIFIQNLCLSVFGGIQPDKLTRYLEQSADALTNDGMFQRFQMLVYPDDRRWEWRNRGPDKAALAAVVAIFEKLAAFAPTAWGAVPADENAKIPYFRLDEEAQELFVEWSCRLHLSILPCEAQPLMAQHLTKFEKLVPALALIFYLVDCAAGGGSNAVSKVHVARAVEWCTFLESHARRCYGLLADDGLRAAQALADQLRQGKLKNGFTARDVRRNQWRFLTTEGAVQAALEWLEDEGWLRAEEVGGTGPGSGRRTLQYTVNPQVRRGPNPADEDGPEYC